MYYLIHFLKTKVSVASQMVSYYSTCTCIAQNSLDKYLLILYNVQDNCNPLILSFNFIFFYSQEKTGWHCFTFDKSSADTSQGSIHSQPCPPSMTPSIVNMTLPGVSYNGDITPQQVTVYFKAPGKHFEKRKESFILLPR